MGHRFQVYDVDTHGHRYNTGKVIHVQRESEFNRYDECTANGSEIQDLFQLYGFVQYVHMYRLRRTDGGFEITYNYNLQNDNTPGTKPTWYLKRGD